MFSLLRQHATQKGLRLMSSESPKLYNFAVYAPDVPNSAELRAKHRPIHLKNAQPLIDTGILRVGGKMVTPETMHLSGEESLAIGSILILKAESLDACRKIIENDIYYTGGTWDTERLVIAPFVSATKFRDE